MSRISIILNGHLFRIILITNIGSSTVLVDPIISSTALCGSKTMVGVRVGGGRKAAGGLVLIKRRGGLITGSLWDIVPKV
jgi:hypothetical protein